MRFVRTLFVLRSLPARLIRGGALPADPARPLTAQMVEFGFVVLAEDEREVVLGASRRFPTGVDHGSRRKRESTPPIQPRGGASVAIGSSSTQAAA